jgi:DNA repair protein RecO
MHAIHVTEGLVLAKRGVGEAHANVSLLTKEHGLVRARATSARLGRSKLRYGLEPLTLGRFSLVRGRQEWRLVGVEQVTRLAPSPSLGRVSSLLLRLVAGEEPNPALFEDVKNGFVLLAVQKPAASLESIEIVLVLRILSHLGYLPHSAALAPYIEGRFSVELSAHALEARALLVSAINESLKATGL